MNLDALYAKLQVKTGAKLVLLVLDGLGDIATTAQNETTPLEAAATPNLDALAHDSVVFTRAYSQAPLTAPSHATILTGTYPQFHQVNNFGVPLANDLPYAPTILKTRGYHTAAFVGAIALDRGERLA